MKTWATVLFIFISGACRQKTELTIEEASKQFCDCFNIQVAGSTDDRLSPCLQKLVEIKQTELKGSEVSHQDSIQQKISRFSLDIMLDMTWSCNNYFTEINNLYDKGYPLDTTRSNWNAINELTARIQTQTNNDSIKSLLHKKAHKLIQAREFELALKSIDSIKLLDNADYGANLASAYIFNQTGQYDKAIIEINRAIEISGNENLKLFESIAERRKQMNKELTL